jgi:hypothetical protein
MPQNLATWGRRLYFPSEEVMLRIFIALKSIVLGKISTHEQAQ